MIKAIVTDIEGTTSSLSFVKDILFPYAKTKLPEFVSQHQHETSIQKLLLATCQEANIGFSVADAIAQLLAWIEEDKKSTPLKALQGLVWQSGYDNGELKGHLYPDAIVNLRSWFAQGYALYVYSSGSVLAQKLLFGHSDDGDLTPLFSGFFDTNVGGKRESDSYLKIAAEIGLLAANILFLSDIKEELDAARTAGYQTIWLTREQLPDCHAEHRQVSSFAEVVLLDGIIQ